uniref:EP300 interacting inhibitor of differentiation 2 n=2 Tax=Mustelidae TaxID=9655 RepID=M3Z1Z4_MUSPF
MRTQLHAGSRALPLPQYFWERLSCPRGPRCPNCPPTAVSGRRTRRMATATSGRRRIQELEERRRRFVEACRAREAAFDAEYQRNPQRMDFDILTFTIALTASEVINPLIEELGCDKFISRE